MKRLLITGATGNVGAEVIRFLAKQKEELEVVAGVRDPAQARSRDPDWPVRWVAFDFEQPSTFSEALRGIDAVFLHFLPRLQPEPRISSFYETLTGKKPTTLLEFARREKAILDQESS